RGGAGRDCIPLVESRSGKARASVRCVQALSLPESDTPVAIPDSRAPETILYFGIRPCWHQARAIQGVGGRTLRWRGINRAAHAPNAGTDLVRLALARLPVRGGRGSCRPRALPTRRRLRKDRRTHIRGWLRKRLQVGGRRGRDVKGSTADLAVAG